jgi:dephospho-CoA kinase
MKFWGITGGIGSGKSLVLAELSRRGFPVLDTDVVSRAVVDPSHPEGREVLDKICALAGIQVLRSDGTLNRSVMRDWIAQGDSHRVALEKILHPRIRAAIMKWMQHERTRAAKTVGFVEASRMIESGLTSELDGILWVTAPRELRLERAASRDGRSLGEVAALADLQLPDADFSARATETIVNSGSLDELNSAVTKFLRKAALVTLVVLGLSTLDARAQDSQEWFPSARARSMGLALTAIVDDNDALHTNPAGLALVEERTLRLPDLFMASFSSSFSSLIKEFRDLDTDSSSTISQQLQKFDGTAAGAEFALLSAYWTKPRVGIAVNPVGLVTSARVRTPSLLFAKMDLYAAAQGGVTVGYGHPLLDNHLRLGVALKPFAYRIGLKASLENQDIANVGKSFSDYAGGGWGIDADFGAQGNLDPIDVGAGVGLKLMAGLALQNTFENSFSLPLFGSLSGNAPATDRRLNLGFAGRLVNPGVIQPTLSIEFRDILTSYDEFLEFLHIGFEFAMRPRDFYSTAIRLSMAKGNLGGGIAFHWQIFELEVGTYAVNLGSGPGLGADRRYYMQTALEF